MSPLQSIIKISGRIKRDSSAFFKKTTGNDAVLIHLVQKELFSSPVYNDNSVLTVHKMVLGA